MGKQTRLAPHRHLLCGAARNADNSAPAPPAGAEWTLAARGELTSVTPGQSFHFHSFIHSFFHQEPREASTYL